MVKLPALLELLTVLPEETENYKVHTPWSKCGLVGPRLATRGS